MISAHGITKTFKGITVLKGINYDINPGECHLWSGDNGCGKTTFSRIISGLELFDEGTLKSATTFRPMLVQQDFTIWPQLSVEKNLNIATPRSDWLSVAQELDLSSLYKKKAGILSYGQKQRLCLARGLSIAPDLLIMDEAVSHLDQSQLINVRRAIQKRLENGMACIWITHRPEELKSLQYQKWQFKNHSLKSI